MRLSLTWVGLIEEVIGPGGGCRSLLEFANDGTEAEVTTAAEVEGSVGGVVSISMASLGDEMSGGGGVRCSSSLSSIMMQQQSRSNEFI